MATLVTGQYTADHSGQERAPQSTLHQPYPPALRIPPSFAPTSSGSCWVSHGQSRWAVSLFHLAWQRQCWPPLLPWRSHNLEFWLSVILHALTACLPTSAWLLYSPQDRANEAWVLSVSWDSRYVNISPGPGPCTRSCPRPNCRPLSWLLLLAVFTGSQQHQQVSSDTDCSRSDNCLGNLPIAPHYDKHPPILMYLSYT